VADELGADYTPKRKRLQENLLAGAHFYRFSHELALGKDAIIPVDH
jgi:hypothetical protein